MAKILVYDLDAKFCVLLKTALTSLGYEALIAADGYSVVPLAEAQGPDLVILDYKLPDADGFEILKRLRISPKCGSTPVIFVSDTPKFEIELTVMDTVAVGYADKPLNAKQLKEAIEALIGPSPAAPAKAAPAPAAQPRRADPASSMALPAPLFTGESDLDGAGDEIINLD